jgi:hypothetical protein
MVHMKYTSHKDTIHRVSQKAKPNRRMNLRGKVEGKTEARKHINVWGHTSASREAMSTSHPC